MKHNDWFCPKYKDVVLPDENGKCSLCGAELVSESFPITSLNWGDLNGRFKPEEIAKLTKEDMEWIANKMANAYLDGQFWSDMDYFVREILNEREF